MRSLSNSSIDSPSTPAAPLLALTLRYASQTTSFAIANGFSLLTGSFRPAVDPPTSQGNPPPLLRPRYRASSLLWGGPPLCPALVLSPSRFLPLGVLPSHRGDRFSRSVQQPESGSRHLYAGRRLRSNQVSHAGLSRDSLQAPVSTPLLALDTSSVVHSRSPSRPIPDASWAPFPQRSPPRLLTGAACGGLEPPPEERLRGAFPHLLDSSAVSDSLSTCQGHLQRS